MSHGAHANDKKNQKKSKKLISDSTLENEEEDNHNGKIFIPNCTLINFLISDIIQLESESNFRWTIACESLEHRSNKSKINTNNKCGCSIECFFKKNHGSENTAKLRPKSINNAIGRISSKLLMDLNDPDEAKEINETLKSNISAEDELEIDNDEDFGSRIN